MGRINVGEKFPEISYNTAFENDIKIYDRLADKTVIWVLRYIGCTVCHYDVQVALNRYEEIKAKNANIIFVMQSDKKHISDAYAKEDLPFDIVCDPEMNIYKMLDIKPAASMEELVGSSLDKLQAKGAKAGEMGFSHGDYEGDEQQLPAMFILNKDGVVEQAFYAKDITDLPDFDGVLALL